MLFQNNIKLECSQIQSTSTVKPDSNNRVDNNNNRVDKSILLQCRKLYLTENLKIALYKDRYNVYFSIYHCSCS